MIVTDLNFFLEDRLVKKLDYMILRCEQEHPKKDALLIIEGAEGEGKSNTSVACSYYIKSKTNRDIHLFFRLKELISFAQNTSGKIIIWDEPALDALSIDWYNRTNKDLMRLLMAVRRNRHFFIFNLTKFYKFNEYMVVDRGLGLIHMYSRREIEPGRFVYIRRKNLEELYRGYKTSKKRLYKQLTSFRGSFPEVLEKYFDKMDITVNGIPHATYEDYDREKNKAIQSIGGDNNDTKQDSKEKMELFRLKKVIGNAKCPIKTKEELASKLEINVKTLRRWSLIKLKDSDKDPPTSSDSPKKV